MAFGTCRLNQLTVLLMMCFSEAVWSEGRAEMTILFRKHRGLAI